MRRLTGLLCALDAVAAVTLVYCAVIANRDGHQLGVLVLGLLAVLFALALAHTTYLADELRAALVRLERASRPGAVDMPFTDALVTRAMAGWCCDTAVITAGQHHDPDRCTREDQTT